MELRIYGRKQTDNLLYVQDYSRLILEGQIFSSFSQLAQGPAGISLLSLIIINSQLRSVLSFIVLTSVTR